jgi:hypothetical protein
MAKAWGSGDGKMPVQPQGRAGGTRGSESGRLRNVRAAPAEAVIPNGIERISGVMMMASYGPLPANLHAIHWRPALLR